MPTCGTTGGTLSGVPPWNGSLDIRISLCAIGESGARMATHDPLQPFDSARNQRQFPGVNRHSLRHIGRRVIGSTIDWKLTIVAVRETNIAAIQTAGSLWNRPDSRWKQVGQSRHSGSAVFQEPFGRSRLRNPECRVHYQRVRNCDPLRPTNTSRPLPSGRRDGRFFSARNELIGNGNHSPPASR